MKQKLFLILFMAFVPIAMIAYDCVVDGIYYDLDTSAKTAEVTFDYLDTEDYYYPCYSGSVTIPSSIVVGGTTYTVTSIGSRAFYCSRRYINEEEDIYILLTSITIPSTVTSIGQGAFAGCSGLTSVDIPNSVTSIGNNAFYGCSGMTSITIPSRVTSIENNAFQYCRSLTSINIPNSVTSIGDYAFEGCWDLTSVTIPNSVTSIGYNAFYGCSGLTSVTIPNSVTRIGYNAFYGCSNLTSVTVENLTPLRIDPSTFTNRTNATLYVSAGSLAAYQAADYWKDFNEIIEIPNIEFADDNVKALCVANWDTNGDGELSMTEAAAVTDLGQVFKNNADITTFNELQFFTGLSSIGYNAFYGCSGLTSVTIPSSVTSIGNYAFSKCSGLTSIDIPSSVTSIGNYAFTGCSGLTSINIPNSVKSIGESAFSSCSGLTSIIVASGNSKYDSRNNCNAIIEKSSNTLIVGCKNTIIPNGVTSIGESAFSGCSGLTSVTISNGVTSIGRSAFASCSGLTSIEIPSSVTSIETNAFVNCSHLESVNISDLGAWCNISFDGYGSNPLEYAHYLFLNGARIDDLVIPNSVTQIKTLTFVGGYFSSVSIPSTTSMVGSSHFSSAHIGELIISKSVSDAEFFYATIDHLLIEPSATYGGYQSFYGAHIGKVEIPYSATPLGYSDGRNSYALFESATVGTAIIDRKIISSYYGTHTKSPFYIGTIDSLYVGANALYWNDGLCKSNPIKDLFFDGITEISANAFNDISIGIENIHLPEGLTSIGSNAFPQFNLSVTVENQNPISITSDVFSNRANGTLYVPAGTKAAYEAADVWKEFGTIIEMEEQNISPDDIYLLKNVETGKYLYTGNAWGTHAVLADVGLPAQISKQSDGSYTIFFPVGSGNQQMLFRANEESVYVDYYGEGCPFWTFTNTGNGNYLIQTLTTHETYGQEAMPDTYLGNDPTKEAHDQGGTALGVYNDVDGSVTNAEGMNITWTLEPVSARSDAQVTLLQELITTAQELDMDTGEEETLLNNQEATYLEMTETIVDLQKRIKERENDINKANKKKEDLNMLIACANAIGVDTGDAQAVADNSSSLEEVNEAISSLRETYINKLGEGVATTLLPLDVTGVILNPSFVIDDADGWTWNEGEDGPGFECWNNAEYFERTFNFHQQITGLPNGNYVLKVKGFHRPGSYEDVFNDYQQGTDNATVLLYANYESVTLANIASGALEEQIDGHGVDASSDGTTRYVPDNMHDANVWFTNGYFENELSVTVTDGTLTIGIRLDESVESGWVIFDNFRLEYQGAASPAITFADAAVKAICVDNWDTNHDGELSMDEAAAVTDLGQVFHENYDITSFDELQYYTGLTSIGAGTFDNCHNLISVTIPSTVTSLESCAFCGTWSLQSLVIPNGVVNIEELAIGWQFNLASITIPGSVISIGNEAFAYNGSLASVTVEWENPLTVSESIFTDVVLENATLYVPVGTKDAYQSADVWKDFGNIVEYTDLVKNGKMEENPSEDWSSFWVHEWRSMEEQFDGPANIVEDPTNASNHCVKVVVRSEAEAREAGNMIEDDEGNYAVWESQFFIQSKVKIESGKKLRLIMRVRADKAASIGTQAHQTPGDYNHWGLFGDIDVTPNWKWVEREVVITPDMTQENNGKEMRTIAFNLATLPDGNVFYFDDIKLVLSGGTTTQQLLCELIANMETIGGYELDDAKAIADNNDATNEELEDAITQLQQQIKDRCANAEVSDLPVDATGLITNPSFTIDNAVYWQGDTPQFESWNNAEFFQTAFNFNQELTGLPNGNYVLKVKGFHRPGSYEDVFNDYQQGTDNATALLYANDESVTLVNIASDALEEQIDGWCGLEVSSDGTTRYVPDNMHDASVWFANGYYENELPVTVTDGTLTIGIRLDESVESGWVIFDDFRLEYRGENKLTVAPVTIHTGTTSTLSISLENEATMAAFEFYLQLPEGVSIADADGDGVLDAILNSERSNRHSLEVHDEGDGQYHFLCYSSSNNALNGNSGEILSVVLTSNEDLEPGTYQGTIHTIKFSDSEENHFLLDNIEFDIEVTDIQPGDVNNDGDIDVFDVVAMVNRIMGTTSTGFVFAAADLVEDGIIDVFDLVKLVNIIMSHGASGANIGSFDQLSGNLSLRACHDGSIALDIADNDRYVASQFIVTLTEGQRLAGVTADSHHTVTYERIADDKYAVVCYSNANKAFSSNEGILNLQVTGRGSVNVENVLFVNTDDEKLAFQNVMSGYTDGIGSLNLDPYHPTDIYSTSGALVRKAATTTEGLNPHCS